MELRWRRAPRPAPGGPLAADRPAPHETIDGGARPLRVVVVLPFGFIGGAELWLLQMLDATTQLEVTAVLLADGPLRAELEARGMPVRVRRTGRRVADQFGAAVWLGHYLRRDQVDLVLANGVKAAVSAVPAARARRLPVVWVKHDYFYDAWLSRPLAAAATRVVATDDGVGSAAGRSDVLVLPPPRSARPPADRVEASRFWAERGIVLGLEDAPAVAMVGRIVPYKGIDTAIAALAKPPAAAWRLMVVGAEDPSAAGEIRRLEAHATGLGVRDRVHFAGSVPGAGHWLAAFDALAILTRVDERGNGREGFGMSALEAMLAGVPVIAVESSGAARRLVRRAGLVVPDDDAAAVASALARLSDRTIREAAGAAGRELSARHPDAATTAAHLVAVLTETAGRRHRRWGHRHGQ
jgi:glycosyltransferase involved in cell wall biosynthesis